MSYTPKLRGKVIPLNIARACACGAVKGTMLTPASAVERGGIVHMAGYCKSELCHCDVVCKLYQCMGCNRFVPYCFGAADEFFDFCDDCAVVLIQAQDEDLDVGQFKTRNP